MSSESVRQVARSWVEVGSFHTFLFGVVYFAIAPVREFLDTPSYICVQFRSISVLCTNLYLKTHSLQTDEETKLPVF
jgi:hypothetical protein